MHFYLILSISASSLLKCVVKGHRHLETKDLSNLPWEMAQIQKKYRGSRNSIPHTLNEIYVYGCIKHWSALILSFPSELWLYADGLKCEPLPSSWISCRF